MIVRTLTASCSCSVDQFPKSIFAQYQSTTPIFQFRPDQSSTFKRLYFSGTSNVRLDRSKYHFVSRRMNFLTTLALSYFLSRVNSTNALNRVQFSLHHEHGRLPEEDKMPRQLPYQSSFDDVKQTINITLNAPLENKTNIGFFAQLNNPMNSGMFQFNLMASKDMDSANKVYVGSWIVTVN